MHGNPAVLSGLAARPGDSLGCCTGTELAFPGTAHSFPFSMPRRLWKYCITKKQNKTTLPLFRTLLIFSVLVVHLCLTLCGPSMLLCPWNSPGKNTGVGSHSLLQGIFLTQGSNQGLLYCRQILYHLGHQGSPFLTFMIPPNCTNGDYALKEKLSPVMIPLVEGHDDATGVGW